MVRRKIRIFTRLDDNEYDLFSQLLKESLLSNTSEFVRQAVLTAQVKSPPSRELIAIRQEIQAIGNNINQIAKVANASGMVSKDTINELLIRQKELLAIINTLF